MEMLYSNIKQTKKAYSFVRHVKYCVLQVLYSKVIRVSLGRSQVFHSTACLH